MHDRVDEILAERSRIGDGVVPAVAGATLLHAAIAAAAIWAAMHTTPAETVHVLNIKFSPIQMPAAAPSKQVRKHSAKSSPPVTPAVEKTPVPAPVVPKLVIPPAAVPDTPPAAKPLPKSAPPSPFGKSTKKVGATPVPAPPPPVTTTTPAKAPARATTPTPPPATETNGITTDAALQAGTAGVTGIDGDFPFADYIERMKALIGGHWFRPQLTGLAIARIAFTINRDGSIRDAKIEAPSGNGSFDRAALRAVLETAQLPALPYRYAGTYLGVHLTFK
jgi:TonB family protein